MAVAPLARKRRERSRSRDLWRAAAILSAALSLSLAASTVDGILLERKLRESGVPVEGTIKSTDGQWGEALGVRKAVLGETVVTIQLTVNGTNQVITQHLRTDPSVAVGQRITLAMDPKNPSRIDVLERLRPAWLFRATGFFLSLMLVGVCFGVARMRPLLESDR